MRPHSESEMIEQDNVSFPLLGTEHVSVQAEDDHIAVSPKRVHPVRICCMLMMNFAIMATGSGLRILALPDQVKQLFPDHPTQTYSILIGTASALTVLTPMVGFLSDKCRSRFGRRRPFMLAGGVLSCAGLLMIWFALEKSHGALLVIGFMTQAVGGLGISGSLPALIPDIVPASQNGLASGLWGFTTMLGIAGGAVMAGFVAPPETSNAVCIYFLGIMAVCTMISLFSANEQPAEPTNDAEKKFRDFMHELLQSVRNPDFAKLLLGRVFYNIATAPFAFMIYSIKDIAGSSNPVGDTGLCMLIAMTVGVVVTVPLGMLSDRVGRKNVIYVSTPPFAVVYLLFVFSPRVWGYFTAAAIIGIAQAAYSTVDMALAVDVLPNARKNAAQNMALWGTSQSAGQAIGDYTLGPLLTAVGRTPDPGSFTRLGYIVSFAVMPLFSLVSTVCVAFVRTSK